MGDSIVVPYEASALAWDESDTFGAMAEGASGLSVYDAGFPVGAPVFHNTDQSYASPVNPDDFVHWDELDYEIGGEVGAVDRNAYVLGGMDKPDAHDFRGDHAVIAPRDAYGSYGAVGWDSDDYPNAYSQGVAAQAYPEISREESWDSISAGM